MKIYIIISFGILSYILFSCESSENMNELKVPKETYFSEVGINLIDNVVSDSIWRDVFNKYLDTISKEIIPNDFKNSCFERQLVLKHHGLFKLRPIKSLLIDKISYSMLKIIVKDEELYNGECEDGMHEWNFPVDSIFEETNLWELAKIKLDSLEEN